MPKYQFKAPGLPVDQSTRNYRPLNEDAVRRFTLEEMAAEEERKKAVFKNKITEDNRPVLHPTSRERQREDDKHMTTPMERHIQEAKLYEDYFTYPQQVKRNLFKGASNVAKVGTDMVLPAAAMAATAAMAVPAAVAGSTATALGVPTFKAAAGVMGRAVAAGIATDQLYFGAGGKAPGDLLDIQNPIGRFALNLLTPGFAVGGTYGAGAGKVLPSARFKNPKPDSIDNYFGGKVNEPIKKLDVAKRIFKGEKPDQIYDHQSAKLNKIIQGEREGIKDEVTRLSNEIIKITNEPQNRRKWDQINKGIRDLHFKKTRLPSELTLENAPLADSKNKLIPQYAAWLEKKGLLQDALKNPRKYLDDDALLSEFTEQYPRMSRGVRFGSEPAPDILEEAIKIGGDGQRGPGSYHSNSLETLQNFSTVSEPGAVGYKAFTKVKLPGWENATNKERIDIIRKHVAYGEGSLKHWYSNPEKIMLEVNYGDKFKFAERVIKKDAWQKYSDLIEIEEIFKNTDFDANIEDKFGYFGLKDAESSSRFFSFNEDIVRTLKKADPETKRMVQRYNNRIRESIEAARYIDERIKTLKSIQNKKVKDINAKTEDLYEQLNYLDKLKWDALKDGKTAIEKGHHLYENIIMSTKVVGGTTAAYPALKELNRQMKEKGDEKRKKRSIQFKAAPSAGRFATEKLVKKYGSFHNAIDAIGRSGVKKEIDKTRKLFIDQIIEQQEEKRNPQFRRPQ